MYLVKKKETGEVVAYCTERKDAEVYYFSQEVDGIEYIIENTDTNEQIRKI